MKRTQTTIDNPIIFPHHQYPDDYLFLINDPTLDGVTKIEELAKIHKGYLSEDYKVAQVKVMGQPLGILLYTEKKLLDAAYLEKMINSNTYHLRNQCFTLSLDTKLWCDKEENKVQ